MLPPLTPGRIRDPIHGYIAFTAIERALLDHPIAQRLRYVGQSAAAHLVFPEMRVSRMSHSLGAMHLASRFLQASLANAADAEREEIVAGCKALVERLPFRPWRAGADGQSVLLVRTPDGPVPLTRLSSLVGALGPAWGEELQVFAFARERGLLPADEVISRLEPALMQP